jgi:glycosyltransferase involved in cell wall biosynthesis
MACMECAALSVDRFLSALARLRVRAAMRIQCSASQGPAAVSEVGNDVSESAPSRPRLSACIITLNEEDRIRECLESLDFCDDVLVVDSHSTDRTREIAAECGARVIERDWPGYVAQKEYAVRQAEHDWVLCLDADERIGGPLREEILRLRGAGFPEKAGWRMPRRSFYMGRWVMHGTWTPDYNLRLFDRRHGHWGGYNPHDRVVLDGPMGTLHGKILHYPYRSLAEHLATMDKYTTIMAKGLDERGKKGSVINVMVNPWVRFVKYYVLKGGFLDGWHGLVMAYLAAQYVRMKYIKLLVMQRVGEKTD